MHRDVGLVVVSKSRQIYEFYKDFSAPPQLMLLKGYGSKSCISETAELILMCDVPFILCEGRVSPWRAIAVSIPDLGCDVSIAWCKISCSTMLLTTIRTSNSRMVSLWPAMSCAQQRSRKWKLNNLWWKRHCPFQTYQTHHLWVWYVMICYLASKLK